MMEQNLGIFRADEGGKAAHFGAEGALDHHLIREFQPQAFGHQAGN